jgi:hypothetical protein
MDDHTVLAYFGHHRCASRWLIGVFRQLCQDLNLEFGVVNTARSFDCDLSSYVRENHVGFLAYRNAEYQYVRDLHSLRGFHVVRDPRDIVISAYFSHLYSHPTKAWPQLIAHRERLQSVSQDEGLRLEMAFLQGVFRALGNWDYAGSRFFEVRMEDMIQNPPSTILKVCRYLGLVPDEAATLESGQLSEDAVLSVVHERRFSVQAAGRKAGEEDVASHFRKGVAGDWRNYFTPDHIRLFKEHYNTLLIHMGYETSSDW